MFCCQRIFFKWNNKFDTISTLSICILLWPWECYLLSWWLHIGFFRLSSDRNVVVLHTVGMSWSWIESWFSNFVHEKGILRSTNVSRIQDIVFYSTEFNILLQKIEEETLCTFDIAKNQTFDCEKRLIY